MRLLGTDWLRNNRMRLELEMRSSGRRRWVSPVLWGLTEAIDDALARVARGPVLDAGAGTSPYRKHLLTVVSSIDSIDLEQRGEALTFVGDIQDMAAVLSAGYDTVVCSEVLEHLPRPEAALREMARVLRPTGRLIRSAPFLSRLHEEPHDYYRYTEHGLRELLTRTGFDIVSVRSIGSVFSFLGHQVSTLLLSMTWPIPVVRDVVFLLNALLIVVPCRMLDRISGLAHKLPAGYVVVGQRTEGRPGANRYGIGA